MDLSILIPYGGHEEWRERSFSWLLRRYALLFPGAQIVVGSSGEPFNRAEARNRAFSRANGGYLLIADADTLFHPAQITTAIHRIRNDGRTWVLPYKWYYNMSQEATEAILALPPDATVPEPMDVSMYEHMLESWAGLLVLPREAYETVGGYDERFIGWGYEDNAFRLALDTLWGRHSRLETEYCLHLWHPAPEEDCFGQPNIYNNRSLFRDYEAAVGNPSFMRRIKQ